MDDDGISIDDEDDGAGTRDHVGHTSILMMCAVVSALAMRLW